jgi:protein ImuB
MLWLALHCPPQAASDAAAAPPPEASITPALACWAGRYTPRVNLAPDALRLDIGASLRLFGGLPALLQQLRDDLAAMALPAQSRWRRRRWPRCGWRVPATAWSAPTWRRRAPRSPTVPLAALRLAPPLARRIEGFGLRRLGDVLALPRASLGARLGKPFVIDLARALGELPDPQTCFVFPERFEQALELPAPVEAAPVLLFAARRLVAALAGWLAARNGAVRALDCLIEHGHGHVTALPLAFSAPVHEAARIERVLKESLDALRLPAPALALRLCAPETVAREAGSLVLFDGAGQRQEALAELMDRLAARLGAPAVQGLACHADHRPEHASRAHPAAPARRSDDDGAAPAVAARTPRSAARKPRPPATRRPAAAWPPVRNASNPAGGTAPTRAATTSSPSTAPAAGYGSSATRARRAGGSCMGCLLETSTGYVDTAVCRVIHG